MSSKKRRILFVVPTLHGGGAEPILIRWLRHYWDRREEIEPSVVFSNKKEGPHLDDLPEGIKTFELGQDPEAEVPVNILLAAWRLNRIYRRLRPDLVVGVVSHASILALLSARLFRYPAKVVACEHVHLSSNIRDFYPRAHAWVRGLIRWLYPSARGVIAVSEGVKADIVANFGVRSDAVRVVYNPVDVAQIQALSRRDVEDAAADEIVAMGRLVNQKGFDCLLRALVLVRRQNDVRLTLVGDGPLRPELERLAGELDLRGAVRFVGYRKNPMPYLARASVFVLSSLYEGLGNVILEAMALGVPVIATRCPAGPDEIITDGRNGILVPPADENALAGAILRVLREPDLRRRLAEEGRRRAERFSVTAHVAGYERVFNEVLAGLTSASAADR